MKHTPEPWSYETGKGKHEGTIVITSYTMSAHSPLAHVSNICGDAEPDARRIVACVNACEGVSTDTLEHAPQAIGSYIRQGAEHQVSIDTFRDLCGELLFALTLHQQVTRPIDLSTKVIAKAEAVMGENSNG